jgi:hypothetical protein
MARRRYQFGRVLLVLLRGKKCQKWIGRWREDVIEPDGSTRRIERSAVLGTRDQIPTARLARRCLDLILANVNSPDYRPYRVATLAEFSERLCLQAPFTEKAFHGLGRQAHLRTHILPRLGRLSLSQIGIETHQVFVAALSQRLARKTLLNIFIIGKLSGENLEALARDNAQSLRRTLQELPGFSWLMESNKDMLAVRARDSIGYFSIDPTITLGTRFEPSAKVSL